MTKDEALTLALDALETSMYPQQKQLQAITAIKEALAQPEHIGFMDSKLNPIKRTWVGLTDEEIEKMGLSNYIKVVRETEAKLKEKNT